MTVDLTYFFQKYDLSILKIICKYHDQLHLLKESSKSCMGYFNRL